LAGSFRSLNVSAHADEAALPLPAIGRFGGKQYRTTSASRKPFNQK
jgi:hypothetical protein